MTQSSLRVLMIQPDPIDPGDTLVALLESHSVVVDVLQVSQDDADALDKVEHASVDTYDGVIILGGRMNAVADSPMQTRVRELIRQFHEADRPVLGICLGHQLTAAALGGRVAVGEKGYLIEGVETATATPAGEKDPVLGRVVAACGKNFTVFESHNDHVADLPEGAELLAASSDCGVEAYRLGSVLGVQFHPEITGDLVRLWAEHRASGPEPVLEHAQDVDAVQGEFDRVAAALIAGWVDSLANS